MNMEYKYLPNEQVEVLTDNGPQKRKKENNINEILTLENEIEKIDNVIKDLEFIIRDNKHSIVFDKKAKFLICGGIPFTIPALAVCINGITNNPIPGDVLLSLFIDGGIFSIPTLVCFKLCSHKINSSNNGIKNQITKAKEIRNKYVKRLEKVKSQNTKYNEQENIELYKPIPINNTNDLDDIIIDELNNAYNQGIKKRVRALKK